MKKIISILIISVCVFVILVVVGQTFLDDKGDSFVVEEKVFNEVVVAPPLKIVTADPADKELKCVVIDDFEGGSELRWGTVNDGVMGGLSQGVVMFEQDMLVHTGVINTNGGGFSYVGARLPENLLVGYSKLQIRLNTYGRKYAVNFGDSRNRRISHQAAIPLGSESSWQEVFIDFDQTVPTVFSRQVNSARFLASAIDELSFILGDGVDGPFRMEIDWIKACL